MKIVWYLIVGVALITACEANLEMGEKVTDVQKEEMKPFAYAMAIHGGAGTITRDQMTEEQETAYREALNEALTIGEGILKDGGTSLDAIEKTIIYLENIPLFNAGKGAVFTHAGINELDASIMDGSTQNAGAVGGIRNVKNPILAARAVMDHSEHVFLTGRGAEKFAEEQGIETVDPSYFYTERRWNALQKRLEVEKENKNVQLTEAEKHGTVGAVALDQHGNLAAGTSTGGMTNKKYNRIGDSPVIGAGTYADNTCAVSSTGHGEYFIRYAVAHDISAIMDYGGSSLQEAADQVINKKLKEKGGTGGVIAVDHYGNVAMPFNTEGMYRGYIRPGEREVLIYKE